MRVENAYTLVGILISLVALALLSLVTQPTDALTVKSTMLIFMVFSGIGLICTAQILRYVEPKEVIS